MSSFSQQQAINQINQLGYENIEQVPIGRGNDYLTALVNLAKGNWGNEGIDIDIAITVSRISNNAHEGLPTDQTALPENIAKKMRK
ncbi:hypothetical protein CO168_02795 [Candidatus Shapirobacteria bacterium CG_4_9_14_3_um_filter_36_12]|uniref:Uncharacterized protein n=4 Tax=Candidatus Shapironibacteriota TaxID=1752721 RepID=A0A1J5I2G8_9BACT|nr:MAG: hypothetical protein AUK05_03300 [Candidatus Shapirobacteria bacterium CG2_30_35_20]PIV07553.1 MAG: hypothetical protein COS53_01820 [Candidatus Shapirobacteria bacterium CG03_land_8_20_14_0_80_35_14]PJA50873.1 MAG: hypothetical protein CO168_02795 [Candidatus Shapirobacteria bacterium CG_4_9_14_3_um_filter_36_12]PJE66849.1 MAG: hypothetical protein COU93_02015 [Candidatus Shapirobacteria bacterium CG10_big_fil_rev_8_21_14_0_10_36_6]